MSGAPQAGRKRIGAFLRALAVAVELLAPLPAQAFLHDRTQCKDVAAQYAYMKFSGKRCGFSLLAVTEREGRRCTGVLGIRERGAAVASGRGFATREFQTGDKAACAYVRSEYRNMIKQR